MIFFVLYGLFLLVVTIFSWGFVGNNFPFFANNFLFDFFHKTWWFQGGFYCGVIIVFFIFYLFILNKARKRLIKDRYVWKIIVLTILILLPSFPAFSYDIFNYIATAKVAFLYKENPYIVMPIEIPNEPLLGFMHAANKTALYGPIWIGLTTIPHSIGFNNLLITVFTFKIFIIFFYLGLVWLIWHVSEKNIQSVVFFALNPLVLLETFVSGHNDVVMMFFALASFYCLKKRKFTFSIFLLFLSVFIKFATIFFIPIYVYVIYLIMKRRKIAWPRLWFWSAVALYIVFFLSPLREEIYSWYLIWPLVFVALIPNWEFLHFVTLALSFGLLFRFAPFLFTLNWGGATPVIKKIVTFLPPTLAGIYYAIREKI